jgi:hypothetical protein
VALMVAPEYLHLSGVAIPLVFWGGIALTVALILAAAVVALHGVGSGKERGMTAADIGYNTAIAAAVVSLIAAVRRSPRIAVIACIFAWVGIGVDYWFGPPRTFILFPSPSAGQMFTMNGSTMEWYTPSPMPTEYTLEDKPIYISDILIQGYNPGNAEIPIDDAYLASEITGERLNLNVTLYPMNHPPKDLSRRFHRTTFLENGALWP